MCNQDLRNNDAENVFRFTEDCFRKAVKPKPMLFPYPTVFPNNAYDTLLHYSNVGVGAMQTYGYLSAKRGQFARPY